MKKSFIVLITLALLSFGLTGCGVTPQYEESASESGYSMFVIVEDGSTYSIVYHKDTKVMYAISDGGYNHGTFTVMLNPDGTPMLYEGN